MIERPDRYPFLDVQKTRQGFVVRAVVSSRIDFLDFFEGLEWRLTGRLPSRFDERWAQPIPGVEVGP